ncbi:L-rhamnose mutarotase, partial [Rhizobium ruizarguesonis]
APSLGRSTAGSSRGVSSGRLPEHPVVKKWWDYMADIMANNPDNSPVQSDLVTVFHMT